MRVIFRIVIAVAVAAALASPQLAHAADICPESRWLGEVATDGDAAFPAYLELHCKGDAVDGVLHAPIGVYPLSGRVPKGEQIDLTFKDDGADGSITATIVGDVFEGRFVVGASKGKLTLKRNPAATPASIIQRPADEKVDLTTAQWREDVAHFAREIVQRHGSAFHRVSKQTFDTAVAKLDADLAALAGAQVPPRLLQLTAMIGDGHTSVRLPQKTARLPFTPMWFGKELRIVETLEGSEGLLGARIDAINGVAIAEVDRRIRTFASQGENEWFFLAVTPYLMIRSDVLAAAGIASGDTVRCKLTSKSGASSEVVVTLSVRPEKPTWRYVAEKPPIYARHPDEAFRREWWPQHKTVYANFRRYDDLAANTAALMRMIDDNAPAKLILDMRDNGGGDFTKVRDILIPEITKRAWLNRCGVFYVLVNRDVFSAAMTNAIDFKLKTNAMLVGEPIGERPNSWQEVRNFTLPHSGLTVRYSTKFYRFLPGNPDTVMPDKRIDPDWPSYAAGRDAVIEWILEQR